MNRLITDALVLLATLLEPIRKRWTRKLSYTSTTGHGWTRHYDDGSTSPQRWYHRAVERSLRWWNTRGWRRRQREFERTGTRYYGNGGTIHSSGVLDVEVYEGRVVGVWFRCQPLPFRQSFVDIERARSMRDAYENVNRVLLCGVEIKDPER